MLCTIQCVESKKTAQLETWRCEYDLCKFRKNKCGLQIKNHQTITVAGEKENTFNRIHAILR